jgi:hypothetical protein
MSFARRLQKLLGEIGPLLRVGEAICRGAVSELPDVSGPVEFYRCDTAAIGTSVGGWITARKKLAVAGEFGKKQVGVTCNNRRDPYGICDAQSEQGKEYYVRKSGDERWVAIGTYRPRSRAQYVILLDPVFITRVN